MNALDTILIGNVELKNRIIRSATFEGCSSEKGIPGDRYFAMYEKLAKSKVGGIITGFAYTSEGGRAMQTAQAGIDNNDKIGFFSELTERVHRHNCPIFLQVSHAGRQTSTARAAGQVFSSSSIPSRYFRTRPKALTTDGAYKCADEYGVAAKRAMVAGFDGIQIHAAHGYLVHQFLLPAINKRRDEFGIDEKTNIGFKFLEEIFLSVRKHCGNSFPVLVKISGGVDLKPGFNMHQFHELILFLDRMNVAGIEISYGTMDHALNIFRGDFPVSLVMKENPFFNNGGILHKLANQIIIKYYKNRRLTFSPTYNLRYAQYAKTLTRIPVISVGGFRNSGEINTVIEKGYSDIVGLSRPFICEPELVGKIVNNKTWESECINCNHCAVMCDSGNPTICYKSKK